MQDVNGKELQVRDQIVFEDGSITTITGFGERLFFHTGGAHPIETPVTLERRPEAVKAESVVETPKQSREAMQVERGRRYIGVMPWSEVCLHMQVADKLMQFEIVGDDYPMVQLFSLDGTAFSFPIGHGDAGVYIDSERGMYFYPPIGVEQPEPTHTG